MHINETTTTHLQLPKRGPAALGRRSLDARNHYPRIKHHTPHHQAGRQQPTPGWGRDHQPDSPAKGARQDGHGGDGLVVSKPNSVSGDSFTGPSRSLGSRTGENVCCAPNRQPTTGAGDLLPTTDSHECGGGGTILVLLRKEVIQPHLPVRLPCYDFVPIADPTFDGSLPYGLGHRLRVLPTFMT